MNPWNRIAELEAENQRLDAAHRLTCRLLADCILNSPQVRAARATREANAMFGGILSGR